MNGSDIAILSSLLEGPLTLTEVAHAVGKSLPFVSERTKAMEAMRLVERRRAGNSVKVGFSQSRSGRELRLLMAEGHDIGLARVLTGAGLTILPFLLEPGSTLSGLRVATGFSPPTIRGRIRLWRGMGLLHLDRPSRRYSIQPQLPRLIAFVSSYTIERNHRILDLVAPAGVIVWQGRDAFLMTSRREISAPGFVPAGVSRLEQLGYDITSSRHCYLHRQGGAQVSEEEALVQALLIDPDNPRPRRMVRRALEEGQVTVPGLLAKAEVYGMRDGLRAMVPMEGGRADG
jgi:hypothetical protein